MSSWLKLSAPKRAIVAALPLLAYASGSCADAPSEPQLNAQASRARVASLAAGTQTITLISGGAPIGSPDPANQASTDGGLTWQNAFVVSPVNVYHVIPGTQYINFNTTTFGPTHTTVRYRTTFVLPVGYTNPSLSVNVHADNVATVYVNGVSIGQQTFQEILSNFQDPAETFTTSDPTLFHSGTNVLSFDVFNFNGPTGFDYEATVSTRPKALACTTGAVIANVLLPAIDVPIAASKPWRVHFDPLGLDFTVSDPSIEGVLCQAQSNTGAVRVGVLPGSTTTALEAEQLPILVGYPLSVLMVTSAAITVFRDAALFPLPRCFVGGIHDHCILGTTYRPDAHYLRWHIDGFVPTFAGFDPRWLATAPMTYYLDLEQAGFSLDVASMEDVVRGAEAIIHRSLITNLHLIVPRWLRLPILILQDPGNVDLFVTFNGGPSTGVREDGSRAELIPRSFYHPSDVNPAVITLAPDIGVYDILLITRKDGPFHLSTVFFDGASSERVLDGNAKSGITLQYRVTLVTSGGVTSQSLANVPDGSMEVAAGYAERSARIGAVGRSIRAKIDNARAAFTRGNRDAAGNQIRAALREIAAQRGKALTEENADRLTSWLDAILVQMWGT